MRFFNTSGPIVPADHYHIPPLDRLDLDELLRLVRTKRYFTLHAPRQTGKTSALFAFRDLLNGGSVGDFRAVYVNVEVAQPSRGDRRSAMREIRHRGLERTIADGLEQIARYRDRCGAREGHLVVFDRDPERPWSEKLFRREEAASDGPVTVWGM